MVCVYFRRERNRIHETWRQFRWLGCQIINISGKSIKRSIRPESLFKLPDEQKIEIDAEKRKRDALETARLHKSKFWMRLKGGSEKEPRAFGDDPEQRKRWEEYFAKSSQKGDFFAKYGGARPPKK